MTGDMRWASFRYEPMDSPVYRTGMCEAGRHDALEIPARWVEVMFRPDGGNLVMGEVWFTCDACHKDMSEIVVTGL